MARVRNPNISRRGVLTGGAALIVGLSFPEAGQAADLAKTQFKPTRLPFQVWHFPASDSTAVALEAKRRRQDPGLIKQHLLKSGDDLTIFEEWLPGRSVPSYPVETEVLAYEKLVL